MTTPAPTDPVTELTEWTDALLPQLVSVLSAALGVGLLVAALKVAWSVFRSVATKSDPWTYDPPDRYEVHEGAHFPDDTCAGCRMLLGMTNSDDVEAFLAKFYPMLDPDRHEPPPMPVHVADQIQAAIRDGIRDAGPQDKFRAFRPDWE